MTEQGVVFLPAPGDGWESWSDKLVRNAAQPRWNQQTQECLIWFRKWVQTSSVLSPEPPQLPPPVTEAGNHRGEDAHKQNTDHKNESPELLAKQMALAAIHSLAVSQQVEISLASFDTAKVTLWKQKSWAVGRLDTEKMSQPPCGLVGGLQVLFLARPRPSLYTPCYLK